MPEPAHHAIELETAIAFDGLATAHLDITMMKTLAADSTGRAGAGPMRHTRRRSLDKFFQSRIGRGQMFHYDLLELTAQTLHERVVQAIDNAIVERDP